MGFADMRETAFQVSAEIVCIGRNLNRFTCGFPLQPLIKLCPRRVNPALILVDRHS